MDLDSKENFLTKFKIERFSKGNIIVAPKTKIEELYLITDGQVALGVLNQRKETFGSPFLIFGVLEKSSTFNEWALLFDQESPYFAFCVEDVQVLTLEKSNLNFAIDEDTRTDLRANA